jgi:hypothetical protein
MLTNATKECIQIITTITYGIWIARNNKIFQDNDTPAIETVEKALTALHEYKHNISLDNTNSHRIQTSPSCNNTSWSPPPGRV